MIDNVTRPCSVVGMSEPHVLIEASNPYAAHASDLLVAAHFKPVRRGGGSHNVPNILHQIAASAYEVPASGSIEDVVRRINTVIKKTRSRHRDREIVFCVPGMPGKQFVRVIAGIFRMPEGAENLELANTVPDAVARIIQRSQVKEHPVPRPTFALDVVSGIDTFGSDLRDNDSGRLNAEKVRDLYSLKMTAIADAAGISKQGLEQNPDSEKAQPVLKLFERIARLRAHPQFKAPADLRKWFRRPLPLFSNHSAEDLFKARKLEVVAEKVDQMFTGDFGG